MTSTVSLEQVRKVIGDVLQLGSRTNEMDSSTALVGNMPEFDSMSVVSVITALEEEFGILVEDEDITAETFESLGSVLRFVNSKV